MPSAFQTYPELTEECFPILHCLCQSLETEPGEETTSSALYNSNHLSISIYNSQRDLISLSVFPEYVCIKLDFSSCSILMFLFVCLSYAIEVTCSRLELALNPSPRNV